MAKEKKADTKFVTIVNADGTREFEVSKKTLSAWKKAGYKEK